MANIIPGPDCNNWGKAADPDVLGDYHSDPQINQAKQQIDVEREEEYKELISNFQAERWQYVMGRKWKFHDPVRLFEAWTNEMTSKGIRMDRIKKSVEEYNYRRLQSMRQAALPDKGLELKKNLPCPDCKTILEHKTQVEDFGTKTLHILKCPKCGWEVEAGLTPIYRPIQEACNPQVEQLSEQYGLDPKYMQKIISEVMDGIRNRGKGEI